MIALYIVIGIAVGAVVLYLVMNQKVGRLHVELAKKETEMQMLSQQRSEATAERGAFCRADAQSAGTGS